MASPEYTAAYDEVKRLGGDGVTTPTERAGSNREVRLGYRLAILGGADEPGNEPVVPAGEVGHPRLGAPVVFERHARHHPAIQAEFHLAVSHRVGAGHYLRTEHHLAGLIGRNGTYDDVRDRRF